MQQPSEVKKAKLDCSFTKTCKYSPITHN